MLKEQQNTQVRALGLWRYAYQELPILLLQMFKEQCHAYLPKCHQDAPQLWQTDKFAAGFHHQELPPTGEGKWSNGIITREEVVPIFSQRIRDRVFTRSSRRGPCDFRKAMQVGGRAGQAPAAPWFTTTLHACRRVHRPEVMGRQHHPQLYYVPREHRKSNKTHEDQGVLI